MQSPIGFDPDYHQEAPERSALEALSGDTLLEFGTSWCGHCQRAAPCVEQALTAASLRHVKVEDGKGRRLGRSFGVKLWPTLILLRDGVEVGRIVRPTSTEDVMALLETP
ncbi:thioredoxin 1 [Litorivivens lipolytica]|uniref:Thioredoxin 1 n=2 Tax=Litorivivens lipolytica TaxID=1524264 RepID=A0A7W4Z7G6_9GAMM|nr:thioredoxin family protein [Litorivivens lipolytica]MBB3047896.1 thioredoxin 1 [Litorivivens lipolytica]